MWWNSVNDLNDLNDFLLLIIILLSFVVCIQVLAFYISKWWFNRKPKSDKSELNKRDVSGEIRRLGKGNSSILKLVSEGCVSKKEDDVHRRFETYNNGPLPLYSNCSFCNNQFDVNELMSIEVGYICLGCKTEMEQEKFEQDQLKSESQWKLAEAVLDLEHRRRLLIQDGDLAGLLELENAECEKAMNNLKEKIEESNCKKDEEK